jgi:hypothetical protein
MKRFFNGDMLPLAFGMLPLALVLMAWGSSCNNADTQPARDRRNPQYQTIMVDTGYNLKGLYVAGWYIDSASLAGLEAGEALVADTTAGRHTLKRALNLNLDSLRAAKGIKVAGVYLDSASLAGLIHGQALLVDTTGGRTKLKPGTPVGTVADSSLIRAKLIAQVRPVTSYLIYSAGGVADTALNSSVPGPDTFRTNQTAGNIIMERYIRPRAENRFIRVTAFALTSSNVRAWKVTLLVDDVPVDSATGTNITHLDILAPEVELSYAISSGTPVAQSPPVKVGVRLSCVNPGIGYLTQLTVTQEATDAND